MNSAMRTIASFAVAVLVGIACVRTDAVQPEPHATLRIGVWTLWRDREVQVSSAGAAEMRECAGCAARALASAVDLRANGDGLLMNARRVDGPLQLTGAVTLRAHEETLTLHHPVRIVARGGVLVIAVELPVETYVEEVVASESGPADSMESLKALAVVVRSFALHERHGHADYDLCDSTHCQLLHWGGASPRRAAAHAAALATAGETLWFHGQRALAYFNKDCGGRSAAVEEVWPKARPASYLASRADPFCTGAGSEWASQLSRGELASALATHGLAAPGWQRLAVDKRAVSGRVLSMRVDGAVIGAEDFRIAVGESLGWNKVPSTWFEVNPQGDRFFFHGRGWGHGVGLCQKGGAAMAAQGHSETEILAQYFPGAEAADEATGHAWKTTVRSPVVLESLNDSDAVWLPELANAFDDASERSGIVGRSRITVRAFPSTESFRNATLAPGWVAAFTEGNWIAVQPLRILAARHLLADTMRHEFLHVLVEQEASASTPLWLREGLVEVWSASDAKKAVLRERRPVMSADAVNAALAHAATEADSATAHRDAGRFVIQLLDRYGRGQVIAWLKSGVPAGVLRGL